jgi:outer membrane protein TolC
MRLLAALLAGSLLAAAEPADDARSALLRALAGAPAVQAAQERLAAAQRGGGAAGRLPDPMLGAGYARKSTAMERWPVYDVALEQPLPRWGERDARRARAAAGSALAAAELQEALGETAAEVAAMLAEAAAARARLAVVDGQVARAQALQALAAARSASGGGALGDQLGIASRLAALAVERQTQQRLAADAEQEVRARLALDPAAALPPFAAPERARLALERVPGLLAAQARGAEADAMYGEARAGRYPETAVGLRYEREQQPGEQMDTVGLEFRVSLPVWQGAAQDLEAAAAAQRRAARREAAGWEHRARTLLGRAERAAAVAASARAAAEGTRARIDAEYDALVRSAAAQQGATMAAVLDVLERLGEAEGLVIEAEAAARQAEAGLWRLAPPQLEPPQRTQP